MTTLELSPQLDLLPMELPSTPFAAGSPAKTSALQERAQDLPVNARGYGQSTPALLASFDPSLSSWKTSQRCFIEGLATYSETWPRSGMTRNGIAYRLAPLVPLTDGTASGSWPTPTANSYEIADVQALLDRRERVKQQKKNGNGFGLTLAQAVKVRMWPTPTARDWKDGCSIGSAPKNGLLGRVVDPSPETGSLNPNWVEWLMGFPPGWTDCGD